MSTFGTAEVALDEELSEQIRDHASSDDQREVGGILVGHLRNGDPDIQHVLPALEAVGGAAQLTFTHDVWEELLSTVDREYPDEQIVGWYHTHPGHGIFLSSFDRFIHENFFSAPGMVALVVDPQDDDAFGWFGWAAGELVRLGSDLPVDQPDRAPIPIAVSQSQARRQHEADAMDRTTLVVMSVVTVLIAFLGGSWWGARPLTGLQDQVRAANAQHEAARQGNQQMDLYLQILCTELLGPDEPAQEPTESGTDAPTDTNADDDPTEPAPAPTASEPTHIEPTPVSQAHAICSQFIAPAPAPSPTPTVEPSPDDDPTDDVGTEPAEPTSTEE